MKSGIYLLIPFIATLMGAYCAYVGIDCALKGYVISAWVNMVCVFVNGISLGMAVQWLRSE